MSAPVLRVASDEECYPNAGCCTQVLHDARQKVRSPLDAQDPGQRPGRDGLAAHWQPDGRGAGDSSPSPRVLRDGGSYPAGAEAHPRAGREPAPRVRLHGGR